MLYRINIHKTEEVHTLNAKEGDVLLDILRSGGVYPDTPCAGRGTCGKCAVRVRGETGEPVAGERRLLGEAKLAKGYRLACQCTVSSDMDVYIDGKDSNAAIITEMKRRSIVLDPLVKKKYLELELPSLEDQTPDMERLIKAARICGRTGDLSLLQDLQSLLKGSEYKVTVAASFGKLLTVEPGDTSRRLCGAAFDIGTTTVAAYLFDFNSGSLLSVGSMLNPQRKYGADVISRIDYAGKSSSAANELRSLITECINGLMAQICSKAGVETDDVYAAVFSGNTTMLHLLAGLDTSGISVSPFIPVTCGLMQLSAKDFGFAMNRRGIVAVLPCVSAYIGADTVAAVMSCGMYELDGTALLIDIGTNGEIVLGGKDRLIACSTAAGPAFEGANIRHGMGGVAGAVDSFTCRPGFRYTVIGHTQAKGICGSGIIDAVSSLLEAGVIDETGKLADTEEEAVLPPEIRCRLTDIDGTRAFILVPEQESGTGEAVVLTQKDIREIQNAKAAIAAGIETLLMYSGTGYENIEKVWLAGGFGSSMHVESAVRIGLLPEALAEKAECVGNASGSGAAECLLSRQMLKTARRVAKNIEYVELSASSYFTEKYIDNMFFGSV